MKFSSDMNETREFDLPFVTSVRPAAMRGFCHVGSRLHDPVWIWAGSRSMPIERASRQKNGSHCEPFFCHPRLEDQLEPTDEIVPLISSPSSPVQRFAKPSQRRRPLAPSKRPVPPVTGPSTS